MPGLPLSKTLDPTDFDDLAVELTIVEQHFRADQPQHPMRRWEYALALRAISTWREGKDYRYPRSIVDVGGAGSPLWRMLAPIASTRMLDPLVNHTLEYYLTHVTSDPELHDVVTCISVLEHVEDLDRFCYHLRCLTAPGGLLFLTVDYCNAPRYPVADTYDLHWMRTQIFNAYSLARLTADFLRNDFKLLGAVDYTWHGNHIGPPESAYTFASLALVKRP